MSDVSAADTGHWNDDFCQDIDQQFLQRYFSFCSIGKELFQRQTSSLNLHPKFVQGSGFLLKKHDILAQRFRASVCFRQETSCFYKGADIFGTGSASHSAGFLLHSPSIHRRNWPPFHEGRQHNRLSFTLLCCQAFGFSWKPRRASSRN